MLFLSIIADAIDFVAPEVTPIASEDEGMDDAHDQSPGPEGDTQADFSLAQAAHQAATLFLAERRARPYGKGGSPPAVGTEYLAEATSLSTAERVRSDMQKDLTSVWTKEIPAFLKTYDERLSAMESRQALGTDAKETKQELAALRAQFTAAMSSGAIRSPATPSAYTPGSAAVDDFAPRCIILKRFLVLLVEWSCPD